MLNNPPDDEVPQLRRLQDWWLELPLSYRVNALLYFVGGLLLLFLVLTVLSGGSTPRQIQVGAGVASPTTTKAKPSAAAGASPSTAAPSSTSATTSGPTTTASVVANQLGNQLTSGAQSSRGGSTGGSGSGSGGSSGGVGGGGGVAADPGGGGGGGGGESDTTTTTQPPATTTTTTTLPVCRQSQDPRCGNFSWDPAPAPNQALTVSVSVRTANPRVGDSVVFDVTVDDPDHLVSGYCSQVRFGDGGNADGPCDPAPPACTPHFGPWTPPARHIGHYTTSYTHIYEGSASFNATFTFRSWSPDTCLGLDPYADLGGSSVLVTISPPA